ncbi:hypothetical protein MDOR_32830 [Mycolicibacterium doricum]|uniref:Uncharacterized protein n=1 Tax=Mycolicibacterium doricum TaxID=126673 RepID=A0A1X1TIJ9_9MYCO|nr:hypothetical protein AWC01_03825 [Mycolicibacterium doricum]BBZ09114.1 hypothetical protein MDOR_32830 [Mycolicibacterium doricum]
MVGRLARADLRESARSAVERLAARSAVEWLAAAFQTGQVPVTAGRKAGPASPQRDDAAGGAAKPASPSGMAARLELSKNVNQHSRNPSVEPLCA